MTTINLTPYINSTFDMLALRGQKPRGDVLLEQSLADADSSGEITTGINKLAQRFLLRLLTERGSMPYRPDEGTDLMRRLRLGYIRTETALRSAFTIAEARIKALFDRDALETDPDEERFDSATLTGVLIYPGYAQLTIQLRSQAAAAVVVLPIPILV